MRKVLIYILIIPFLLSAQISKAQSVNYKAQSLLLYIFSKNISWPSNSSSEFVIAVYGNSPVYKELQVMARIKKANNGKRFKIINISNVNQITDDISILYISSSKSRDLKKITAKVGRHSTLVVAERDGLARKGAGINFIIMENNALKYEINKTQLTSQKLKPTNTLLKQGYVVK